MRHARELGNDVAHEALEAVKLRGDRHVFHGGHAVHRVNGLVRGTEGEDNVVGPGADGVRDFPFDQIDLPGLGWVDAPPVGDGSLATDDDQDVIARMYVRHKSLTSGEADDVGTNETIRYKSLARGDTPCQRHLPWPEIDGKALGAGLNALVACPSDDF
jgi:hypothetical protein